MHEVQGIPSEGALGVTKEHLLLFESRTVLTAPGVELIAAPPGVRRRLA